MITQLEILNLACCEAGNRLARVKEQLKRLPGNPFAEAKVKKAQALFDEVGKLVYQEEQKEKARSCKLNKKEKNKWKKFRESWNLIVGRGDKVKWKNKKNPF